MTKWTHRQLKHILWLATPKSQRQPKTKESWADRLGVRSRTLRRWERLDGFWDAVWDAVKVYVDDHLAEVLDAQIKKAISDKDTRAARLLLEATGRLIERRQVEQRLKVEQFTADEMVAAAREVDEWKCGHQA